MDIVKELFSGEELTEKLTVIKTWRGKANYSPRRIEFQKRITRALYEHKKYYLD